MSFDRPSAKTQWDTIVGVVADEKQDGLAVEVRPEVYDPQTQDPRQYDVASVVQGRRRSVRNCARPSAGRLRRSTTDSPLYDIRTLEEVVARSLSIEAFWTARAGGVRRGALLPFGGRALRR